MVGKQPPPAELTIVPEAVLGMTIGIGRGGIVVTKGMEGMVDGLGIMWVGLVLTKLGAAIGAV